jgi:hypothetical protein
MRDQYNPLRSNTRSIDRVAPRRSYTSRAHSGCYADRANDCRTVHRMNPFHAVSHHLSRLAKRGASIGCRSFTLKEGLKREGKGRLCSDLCTAVRGMVQYQKDPAVI